MINMKCFTSQIKVFTEPGVSIVDITGRLQEAVDASGVENGTLQATCIGSTGSLTCIEFEPGVVADLVRAINQLAPPGMEYEHEKAWRDGNGHSHVQAALLGPGLVLPVRNRVCVLGTWQQAVVINHDVKSRSRKIELTIIGTG